MPAIQHLPAKDDDLPETPSISRPAPEPAPEPEPAPAHQTSAPRSSMSLIVLVIIISVAAWFFFSNLFTYRTSIAPPPTSTTPTASAKEPEPVFMPTSAPSPQPEIRLPVVATEMETDASKRVTDTAKEDRPEAPELMSAATNTATTAKPRRVRSPRPAAPISPAAAPPTKAASAAAKSGLPSRTLEPTRSGTPQNNAGPAPVMSGSANPQLNDAKASRLARRASVAELKTTIAAYPEATDPDAPVDFALLSAPAPPLPKPAIKKIARQTSGVVVIVNKANSKAFARSDISNIYRDRITRWPSGERILVLDLPLDSGERQRFTSEILEMSPLDAAKESSNRTITNRAQNEYRTKSADVVVSYIERNENAIGYVPATAIAENNNVRIVYSIP